MIRRYCGITRYLKATATVTVHFPIDDKGNPDVRCALCNYFSASGRCRLTGNVSEYPQKYIGGNCPLEFEILEEESPV